MGDTLRYLISWIFVLYLFQNASGQDFCTTVTDSTDFPWTGAALYASSDLTVDPDRCRDECFLLNQTLAGIWKDQYCFCATDFSNLLNQTVTCSTVDGFVTSKSQGSDILYVYEVTPDTVNYKNSDTTDLTFTSNLLLVDPVGSSVGFKYAWSDRLDVWEYSSTNSIKRKPYSTGVYSIIMQAVRQSSKFKINQVSREYTIYSDPTGLNVVCQPYGVIFILAHCTIELATGSQITAELSVDGTVDQTFQLAEVGWSRAGSVVNYYNTEFVTGVSVAGRYLLNAEFQYAGTMTHLEYNANTAAKPFQLALVEPVCASGTFCFSTFTCSADPFCSNKLTCAAPNFYCLNKLACSDTCDRRLLNTYNETTVNNDYKVLQILSLTTTAAGYNIHKLSTPWTINIGNRLMIVTAEPDVIATAPLRNMETPDYFATGANVAVGDTLSKTAWASKSVQHQVTALSQPLLTTKIKFMVNSTGSKAIKIKLTSPAPVSVENTKTMYIGHKINDTQILGKTFALLNEAKTYDLNDHTGANLTYFWSFGDGSAIQNTSSDVATHTYTAMGTYLIVVNITNYIDHRQVNLTVTVITRVVISSITGSTDGAYPTEPKNYTVILTSGTNYNCTLSGEGITTNVTTNEPNLVLSHTWATENYYNVRLECFNEMSRDFKEWRQPCYYKVLGLMFDPLGGETNAVTNIKFKWTQGNKVNFTFLFDNQTKTVTQDAIARTGQSEPITVTTVGRLVGVLRAENPVSDIIIVANLTFVLRVVNLKIVPDKIHTSFGSPIVFTVTMDQGSSMNITVDYGDSLNDTLKMTPEQIYHSSNMSNSHNYASIGEYTVNVTTVNLLGATSAITKVYVLHPLGTYTLNHGTLFLEKNVDFTFNLVRLTGNDPVLTNITIDWKDSTTPLSASIDKDNETNPISHKFAANNEYNVSITLQNPINTVKLFVLVTILDPITNFRCENTPLHTFNNNPMQFKALVDLGSRIDLIFHPGGSETVQNFNWGDVTAANSEHLFTHTYATVNNYTANVTASNPLGQKECIKNLQIQYKIIRTEFTVTPTTFVEFGQSTNTTLSFTGTNFPSGMSATFTFEDGTPPVTKLLYLSDMPYTHSHVVNKKGRSNITVKLENLASSEIYQYEIGAFEKFENFDLVITWGAARSSGFGATKTRFPVKQNIYFKPDLSGKGTVEVVDFFSVSIKNPADIFSCNVTFVNDEFTHMWQDTGDFNVSMVLRNPISIFVKSIVLNIGGSMKDTRIVIPENTLMPMVLGKVRVLWSAIDTDACICIDMGNQTKKIFGATLGCTKCVGYTYANRKPVNNELELRVRYQQVGDYNIQIYIYNDFESTRTNHTLPISRVDCKIPQIQMKMDAYVLPETPQIGQRGLQNIIVAEISAIQCEVTKENVKRWTAHSVDPEYFRVIASINLDSLETSNNTQLIIPPRTLPIGLYKLTFTVVMNKNKTIQTFINYNVTYLRVTSTNVLVSLSTGGLSELTLGNNENVCFYPKKYSRDFDLDVQDFSAWNWTWKCREINENFTSNVVSPKTSGYTFPPSRTGCFGDGPGIVTFSDPSAPCFWAGNMLMGNKYEIVVNGAVGSGSDKREGESKMLISVVNGKPPEINIQCIREKLCKIKKDGEYAYQEVEFNPSDDLLIKASCVIPGSTDACTDGSWIIDIYNVSQSTWTTIGQDIANTYIKGVNSLEMSLLSKFWSAVVTPRFKACYKANSNGAYGKSCIQFFVNLLPSNITCRVDRLTASQTENVCCNCTHKLGLDYMFTVRDNNSLTTLGFNDQGYFCSLLPYSVNLLTYRIRVTNKNGGFIEVTAGEIRTTKLSPTDMEKVLKEITSTDALTMVNAKGDYKKMAEIYLKYVSIMSVSNENDIKGIFGNATENTKTSFGGTGYDSEIDTSKPVKEIEDLTPEVREKLENNRNMKAEMLNKMTRHLDVMVPADIPGLYLVSGVVKSITNSFDTLNREGQGQVANKLVHLATNLQNMESEASKEDVVKISESLLTACFLTDTAANTQMERAIKDDVKRSEIYIDYDVSINSDEESYMEQDASQASTNLKLDTNSKFQGKVAFGVKGNNDRSVEIISKVLRDVSVIDDKPIEIMTSNLQYFVMKTKPEELVGRNYSKGRSYIQLPDICESFDMTSEQCSDPNNPVGIEIMATPTNVRAFLRTPNGNGLPILVNSEVIALSLFTGKKETEKELTKPKSGNFVFTIARDPSLKIANYTEVKRRLLPEPVQIPGTGNIYTSPKFFYQKLIMHQFNLTGSDQSIHFQMKVKSTTCTQFLVVARLGVPPKLSESPDGKIDKVNFTFWGMVPTHTKYCNYLSPPNTPDPYTFFVDNYKFKAAKEQVLKDLPDYSKTRNIAYFGVRELEKKYWNTFTPENRPPVPFPSNAQINASYGVRVYSSGCYHFDTKVGGGWGTTGCQVGALTTTRQTECICNHLTSFSSGWILPPNTIDFNYIFSNFKIEENITIFVTEACIILVSLLIMLWARRKDNKDLEKVGVTPLADNDVDDLYLYELIFDTSIRNGAGTSSNVFFILSGENDETEVRKLEDSKRPILKRGNVDRFLLAVPRQLGKLEYIRVWHDNSGKGQNASWYCNNIGVTDLQTKEKTYFIVNKWFAVEEGDGQIDRLISVSGEEELLQFGQVFTSKMKQDLTEDHLWLSVMARPPESRFTRMERVACCLLLLFLTMLTTCMFYETEGPTPAHSSTLTIGPFAITAKEVWTGLISNIIGFLPLFIIMELFRRSQLRNSHGNKLRKAVEDHFGGPVSSVEFPNRSGTLTNRSTNSIAPLADNEERQSNGSRPNTPGYRDPEQVNVQVIENQPSEEIPPEKKMKIVQRKLFPWWVRVLTWVLWSLILIVAILFTTLYGIQFGDEACKKWLSSMFISFFASVLFTQPIKVVLLAMFFSLICRKSDKLEQIELLDDENTLMNELGQRNGLRDDEEFLHDDLYNRPVRPQRKTIQPISKEEIERAREARLREMKIFDVVREILFYMIYFTTLLVVTYSLRDPNSFTLKTQIERVFIYRSTDKFLSIRTEEQFWNWGINVLVPALRAPVWYNNMPQLFQRGFTVDRNNRLIGYAVMRQIRVKNDSCKVYSYVKHMADDCYAAYSATTEETGNYTAGWKIPTGNNTPHESYTYKTASQLDGLPYAGMLTFYSGAGYVHEFRGNVSNVHKQFIALRDSRWIDAQTRAIFVEFTTYNPNINLFAVNTLLMEFPGTGGMWTSYRIEPANLLGLYTSGVAAFEIFCQVLYGIFIIVMIVKEIRNITKEKLRYFTDFWNLCEIFLIFGSIACVAAFAYVMIATGELTQKFNHYGGKVYIKFQKVAMWNEYLSYLVSFIVFVATLKFIRLLRFNKRMGMLGAVLSYSAKDMKQFFIIFAIMFSAFVMVFYSLFMDSLYRYHTFLHATEASMQIALGKFEFLELYEKEPIFGPIVFAFFVIFIIFVMLNMFIAILNEGFAMVRADVELQSNDFELLDFMFTKLVLWTGLTNTALGQKFLSTGITDQVYRDRDSREVTERVNAFPDKVDQLLSHINKMITTNGPNKGRGSDNKSFNSVIFDKDNQDGNGSAAGSRPGTASSNIIRVKPQPSMTPIDQ